LNEIKHWPDRIVGLKECFRVLKSGGTLAIDVYVNDGILNLFIDKRINTSTLNQIYTSYPGEIGATMLDLDSRLVLGIKKLIEAESSELK